MESAQRLNTLPDYLPVPGQSRKAPGHTKWPDPFSKGSGHFFQLLVVWVEKYRIPDILFSIFRIAL